MTTERYPSDLVITVQDFTDCGWKAVLTSTTRDGYSSMWHSFSEAARQAIEDRRQTHGKVLWLIADACSMMLSPQSINEPFKPFMVMEGRRSVISDDLQEAEVIFFSQLVEQIDDPWLKARLADLVWLLQRKLGTKFALDAIDAYTAIPLDTSTWINGGRECWERAISLSLTLRAGAGDRLGNIESAIITAFDSSAKADGFLALWLTDLLAKNRLARTQSERIATKLESLGHEFDTEGDLHRARSFFDASSNWFQKCGNTAKAVELTVKMAEGWVKEAVARMSSEQPSYMAAGPCPTFKVYIFMAVPFYIDSFAE